MVDHRGEVGGSIQLYILKGGVICLQNSIYTGAEGVGGVEVLYKKK